MGWQGSDQLYQGPKHVDSDDAGDQIAENLVSPLLPASASKDSGDKEHKNHDQQEPRRTEGERVRN